MSGFLDLLTQPAGQMVLLPLVASYLAAGLLRLLFGPARGPQLEIVALTREKEGNRCRFRREQVPAVTEKRETDLGVGGSRLTRAWIDMNRSAKDPCRIRAADE